MKAVYNHLRKQPAFGVLCLVSLGWMVVQFSGVLFALNDCQFSDSGDGLKNYFTFAYHLAHDDSVTEFGGQHYPYGEHIFYTDGHPLLGALLQPFAGPNSWMANHAVGILNGVMLLGVWLVFPVAFNLLRRYQVGPWLAAGLALGAGMLQPQLFRLEGHYALSYGLALPLTWLLTQRGLDGNRRAGIWLSLNLVVWMGMHAYLGVMAVLFSGLIVLFSKSTWKRRLALWAFAALPVVLFLTLGALTDHHVGRTTNPSGLFLYNAELDDLLVPHHGPVRQFLDGVIPGIKLKWEAWAYLGLLGAVAFLLLVLGGLFGWFKAAWKQRWLAWVRPVAGPLLASAVLLLFALGVPYRQFPELAEWFPVIKQFRATGRFDWPFWWVMLVLVGGMVQGLSNREGKRPLRIGLSVMAVVLMVWEGNQHVQAVSNSISHHPNRLVQPSSQIEKALGQFDPSAYQALLPLPFYHVGSEAFTRERHPLVEQKTTELSMASGLPIIGATLTRVSVPETRHVFESLSPYAHLFDKPLLEDERPVLVIVEPQELTTQEADWLDRSHAQTVFASEGVHLYCLPAQHFNRAGQPKPEYHDLMWVNQPTGVLTDDLFLKREDKLGVDLQLFNREEWTAPKAGNHEIATWTFEGAEPEPKTVGLWLNNAEADALNLWFRLRLEETTSDGTVYESVAFPEHSLELVPDWSWVSIPFTPHHAYSSFSLYTTGKDNSKATIRARDLLVKSANENVFWRDESGDFQWNGRPVPFYPIPEQADCN